MLIANEAQKKQKWGCAEDLCCVLLFVSNFLKSNNPEVRSALSE